MLTEETAARIFRSKARWINEGERNTKYFYSLERNNYNKKVMREIRENNKNISEPGEILEAQYRYNGELYMSNNNVHFTLTNSTDTKFMQCDFDMLEAEPSFDEYREALFSMKKDKSPGLDGLTAEFYQAFWDKIGILYCAAIKYAKNTAKKLHLSGRRGLISLIPKKSKDPGLLKNWRPLTMLSLDYKILAKTLATRLKQVLPYLISLDQTGFMEGRQITSTICKTMEIIQYCNKNNEKGYIVNLDYEKAFDKLEYQAIYGSLRYFGIGDEFCEYVSLLLEEFQSCTTNNSFLSDFFDVS